MEAAQPQEPTLVVTPPPDVRWGSPWVLVLLYGITVAVIVTAIVAKTPGVLMMTLFPVLGILVYPRSRVFADGATVAEFKYNGVQKWAAPWTRVSNLVSQTDLNVWSLKIGEHQRRIEDVGGFLVAAAHFSPSMLAGTPEMPGRFLKKWSRLASMTFSLGFGTVLLARDLGRLVFGQTSTDAIYLTFGVWLFIVSCLTWLDADEEGIVVRRFYGGRQYRWEEVAGWAANTKGGTFALTSGKGIPLHLMLMKRATLARVVDEFQARGKFYFSE